MKRVILLLCILSVFLISCSDKPPAPEPPDTDVIAPVVQPEPELQPELQPEPVEPEIDEPVLTAVSPLTGLPCTPEEAKIRPVAVVLNNHNIALPQVSVGEADIVWEWNAEGGITRLVGVYSDISRVGEIGAVRSARDYFLDVAHIHSAILVHAGGSSYFYDRDIASGYDTVDEITMHELPSGTFWRDSDKRYSRGYEHSLETSGEKLVEAFKSLGYETELDEPKPTFEFYSEPTVPDGDTAEMVKINHSAYISPRFTYKDGRYYKESYGEPHIDEATGETVAFENLVIIFAKQRIVDEYLRLDVTFTGEGSGILVTAGKSVSISWSRENEDAPLVLKNTDGTVAKLNPGKTHITVFDANYKDGITIE